MHVKAANDNTGRMIVRPEHLVSEDDDEPPELDEPYKVEFSENNIARVPAEVGNYLDESDKFDVAEHDRSGNGGGE